MLLHSHVTYLLHSHVTYFLLSKQNAHPSTFSISKYHFGNQESQHGEAIILFLELVLDVLSFCVYKVEVMYMFKQSSAVLELLSPHTDVFCINSYSCFDYYHFFQVDQYIYSFCKGVCLQYWPIGSFQPKKKLKNQDERKEKKIYTPFSGFVLVSGTGSVLACRSDSESYYRFGS